MKNVVTNELMRELDRSMMNEAGIPGIVLMENAARRAAQAALDCGREGRITILIGPGNNGGDGLAILRILKMLGRDATGILLADPDEYKGDALLNYRIVQKLKLPLSTELNVIAGSAVIIDAVFGTGLDRELQGIQLEAINMANAQNAYRIAVDIPSGMNGTTGRVYGTSFKADETVTVFAVKRGLLLTPELESVGRITVAPIGLVPEDRENELEREQLIDEDFIRTLLPERKQVTNKGNYGKALIAAGSRNMPGAAVMAARACLRTGAGLTKALVPQSIVATFACIPEVMVCPDTENEIADLVNWCTAIGIGCGMGNDESRKAKLKAVLQSDRKAVIDADGLNAMDEELKQLLNENHVITPHPGEMARLTGKSVQAVVSDPVDAAAAFAGEHGCTVLLKNTVTVIAAPDGRVRYNKTGNTGLAKGGSGDVLTGIITALLAQGLAPFDAASAGAFLLGVSADKALDILKTRMLAAGDVIDALTSVL